MARMQKGDMGDVHKEVEPSLLCTETGEDLAGFDTVSVQDQADDTEKNINPPSDDGHCFPRIETVWSEATGECYTFGEKLSQAQGLTSEGDANCTINVDVFGNSPAVPSPPYLWPNCLCCQVETDDTGGEQQKGKSQDQTDAPSTKKKLRHFCPDQVQELECHFQEDNFPTWDMKAEIAHTMGVTAQKIGRWFQNRRAKARKCGEILIKWMKEPSLSLSHSISEAASTSGICDRETTPVNLSAVSVTMPAMGTSISLLPWSWPYDTKTQCNPGGSDISCSDSSLPQRPIVEEGGLTAQASLRNETDMKDAPVQNHQPPNNATTNVQEQTRRGSEHRLRCSKRTHHSVPI